MRNLHPLGCRGTSSVKATTLHPIVRVLWHGLILLSEQFDTLPRLPFLIRELAGSGIKEMLVVGDGRRPFVQRIVRCRPKEVRRRYLGKIL